MQKSSQSNLKKKTVCVVGVGRLGSLTSHSLVRLGIGKIILIDHDIVEEDNVLRQTSYQKHDVDKLKAFATQKILRRISKGVDIVAKPIHLDKDNAHEMKADLVFDCTDNFKTRHVINDYCKENNIPWVFGALSQNKGQVLVCAEGWEFDAVFGNADKGLTCEEELLNEAVGMVASTQVTQGVKLLNGAEYCKDLILCDSSDNSFERIKIKKNEQAREKKTPKDFSYRLELCESRTRIKVIPSKEIRLDLNALRGKYPVTVDTPILIVVEIGRQKVLIHAFGELNFYNTTDESKIRLLADQIYEKKH